MFLLIVSLDLLGVFPFLKNFDLEQHPVRNEELKFSTTNYKNVQENVSFTNISAVKKQLRKFPMYLYSNNTQRDNSTWVPKILHFIWVSKPIPTKYINAIEKFEADNKDYEITLWCDNHSIPLLQDKNWTLKDVNSVPMSISDVLATEEGSKSVGARTDLLKYEVIQQTGGIYLDTDSKSIKGFGSTFRHSFVCYSLAPWNMLPASIFGMPKGSKFLSFVLESATSNSKQKDYKKKPQHLRYGPAFLTAMFDHYNDEKINMIHKDYLIYNTTKSFMIQTQDASWVG